MDKFWILGLFTLTLFGCVKEQEEITEEEVIVEEVAEPVKEVKVEAEVVEVEKPKKRKEVKVEPKVEDSEPVEGVEEDSKGLINIIKERRAKRKAEKAQN